MLLLAGTGETPRLGLLSGLEDWKAGGALAECAGLLQERGSTDKGAVSSPNISFNCGTHYHGRLWWPKA